MHVDGDVLVRHILEGYLGGIAIGKGDGALLCLFGAVNEASECYVLLFHSFID